MWCCLLMAKGCFLQSFSECAGTDPKTSSSEKSLEVAGIKLRTTQSQSPLCWPLTHPHGQPLPRIGPFSSSIPTFKLVKTCLKESYRTY